MVTAQVHYPDSPGTGVLTEICNPRLTKTVVMCMHFQCTCVHSLASVMILSMVLETVIETMDLVSKY